VADRGLTGVLLVGGASTRFGSPKALARLDGETLAERAWRVLDEACDERLAVGKAVDGLELPFEVRDDGVPVRAALAGLVAGLRAASGAVVVFLPVDMPLVDAAALRALGAACREAAVPRGSPLPGAFRTTVLSRFERRLAAGDLRLTDAVAELDAAVVDLDPALLANVNEPADLGRLTPAAEAPGGPSSADTSAADAASRDASGSGPAAS
jgi:molybdopterin-guanine dinucleotide biosynthesis protein A